MALKHDQLQVLVQGHVLLLVLLVVSLLSLKGLDECGHVTLGGGWK